ncbi:hypothetical protein [Psychromonas ossibalaenae]|uniref:hypothetical protein n=1 Tax=Psychromonas ossibalaenae TaxID=444922 RepID=UPI00037D793E|nr:hypothetical protein [Psychromonas ossibalaenae]
MKMFFKAVAFIFLLSAVIIIIPAFIPDDQYTQGVKTWLRKANNPPVIPDKLNRLNAFVGFNVEEGKDMLLQGASLIDEENTRLRSARDSEHQLPAQNEYWTNPPLKISKHLSEISFVELFAQSPALWLSNNQSRYQALLNDNHILLDRFRKLITMKQYSYTLKPDINGPFIRYRALTAVKNLNNLSIIDEYIYADKNTALKRLQKNITFSKLMMAQSAALLDKMIAVVFLDSDLKTYSALLDLRTKQDPAMQVITNLSDIERTLLNAYIGEFSALSTSLELDNLYSSGEPAILEPLVFKFYLKRKRLENSSHENVWLYNLKQEHMSFAERQQMNKKRSEAKRSWWEYFRDPLGAVLVDITMPLNSKPLSRSDHIDAKITLVNIKNKIYSQALSAEQIESYIETVKVDINPAYSGAGVIWNEKNKTLSFSIPNYRDDDIPSVDLNF